MLRDSLGELGTPDVADAEATIRSPSAAPGMSPADVGVVVGRDKEDAHPSYREEVRDLLSRGYKRLVLDLSKVRRDENLADDFVLPFVDAKKANAEVRVVCTRRFRTTLETLKLAALTRIFDTREEAIASFNSEPADPMMIWDLSLKEARAFIDKPTARHSNEEALAILDALVMRYGELTGAEADRRRGRTYWMLGLVHFRLRQYNTALKDVETGLAAYTRVDDGEGMKDCSRLKEKIIDASVWLFCAEAEPRIVEIPRGRPFIGGRGSATSPVDFFIGHVSVAPRNFSILRDGRDQLTIRTLEDGYTSVNLVQVGAAPVPIPIGQIEGGVIGARIRAGGVQLLLIVGAQIAQSTGPVPSPPR